MRRKGSGSMICCCCFCLWTCSCICACHEKGLGSCKQSSRTVLCYLLLTAGANPAVPTKHVMTHIEELCRQQQHSKTSTASVLPYGILCCANGRQHHLMVQISKAEDTCTLHLPSSSSGPRQVRSINQSVINQLIHRSINQCFAMCQAYVLCSVVLD